MDVSQCQLLGRPVGAKQPCETLFGTPAAPALGKDPGPDQAGECLVHVETVCSSPMRKGGQEKLHPGTVIASTAEPSGIN